MNKNFLFSFLLFFLFSAYASAAPMTFRTGATGNCIGCEYTIAEGEITKDTIAAFEEYFRKEGYDGSVNPVYIHSKGGDFDAALELGRLWRKYKLGGVIGKMDYEVDEEGRKLSFPAMGECLNECVWAFMGTAQTRDFNEYGMNKHNGIIGVMPMPSALKLLGQGKSLTAKDGEILRKSALLSAYALEMGFDIRAAYTGTPDKLHVFSQQELVDYHIIWRPYDYQPWRVEVVRDGLRAVSQSRNGSLQANLYCLESDKILRFGWNGLNDAQQNTINDGLRQGKAFQLLGRMYVPSLMHTEERKDGLWITVKLDGFMLSDLDKEDQRFIFEPFEPYYYNLYKTAYSTDRLKESAALVMRNCLK